MVDGQSSIMDGDLNLCTNLFYDFNGSISTDKQFMDDALSMNSTEIHSESQNRIIIYLWTGTIRIGPELVKNEFGQKVKLEDFIRPL